MTPDTPSRQKQLSAIFAALMAIVVVAVVIIAWRSIQRPLNPSRVPDLWWKFGVGGLTAGAGIAVALKRPQWVSRATIVAIGTVLLLTAIPGRNAADLALVAWVGIVAIGLGERVLHHAVNPTAPLPVPRIGITLPIGLGFIAIIWWVIGIAGALAEIPLLISLILLSIIAAAPAFGEITRLWQGITRFWKAPTSTSALAVAVIALAACYPTFWALTPDGIFDAQLYQLSVPATWVRDGVIQNLPFNERTSWAALAAALYGPFLALVGQPAPSLIALIALFTIATITFGLGRMVAGERVGWVAAVIVVVTPIVTVLGGNTHPDLLITCYTALAVVLGLWWLDQPQRGSRGWLVLMGLAAGFAFSTKMNAITVLIPMAVVMVVSLITASREGRIRRLIEFITIGGISAAVVAAPWLITRAIWTGNPVHPFLTGLFHGPVRDLGNPSFDWAKFGVGTGIDAFLRLPWDLTIHTKVFGDGFLPGSYSLFPLLTIPLVLLVPGIATQSLTLRIWAIVLMSGALWFLSAQYGRYSIPIIPLAAVLVAANLEILLRWADQPTRLTPRSATSGVVALLLVGTATLTILTASQAWAWPTRAPIAAALGFQPREEFLTQRIRTYAAMNELAAINPNRPVVLQVGSPNALYTEALVSRHEAPPYATLRSITDPAALENALRTGPWDYLIVDHRQLDGTGFSSDSLLVNGNDFLADRFPLLWEANRVSLWDLRAEAIDPSTEPTSVPPASPATQPGDCTITAIDPCVTASSVTPNADGLTGTVMITWATGDEANGVVHVSVDGEPATNFAGGPAGTAEAPWIVPGATYTFTVSHDGETAVLASVSVIWEPQQP